MRCLLLLLILVPLETHTSPTSTPILHKFIDDVSKLARVTNAIALHDASIKNQLTYEFVLVELLKINLTSLETLRKLNVKVTSDFLKTLINYEVGSGEFDARTEETKDQFLYYQDWLKVITDNMNKVEEVKMQKDIGTDDYFKPLRDNATIEQEFTSVLMNTNVFKEFKTMESLLRKKALDFQEMKNFIYFGSFVYDQITTQLSDIKKAKPLFVNLLNLFKRTMLPGMDNLNLAFSTRPLSEKLIVEIADAIQNFTKQARTHFATEQGTVAVENIKQAVEVFQQAVSMHDHTKPWSTTWSAAFRSFDDLKKIEQDVNSDWFNEKVLKNKASGSDLLSALDPFLKVAKNMGELGESWNTTINAYEQIQLTMLGVRDKLEQIHNVSEFMKTEGVVESLTASLKGCRASSGDFSLNMTKVDTFVNALEVSRSFNDLASRIVEIINVLEAPKVLQDFNLGVDFIKGRQNMSSQDSLQWALEAFFNAGYYDNFFTTVKSVNMFKTLFDEFKTQLNAMKAFSGEPTSFKEHFNTSKVLDFLDCLKTKQFDGGQIKDFFNYHQSMYDFPTAKNLSAAESLMNSISNVQTEITESFKKTKVLKTTGPYTHLITDFRYSMRSSQFLGRGLIGLVDLERVFDSEDALLQTLTFSNRTKQIMESSDTSVREYWAERDTESFRNLIRELNSLEPLAKKVESRSVTMMMEIFDVTSWMKGIYVFPSEIRSFAELLWKMKEIEDAKKFFNITKLNVNFNSYSGDLAGSAISLRIIESEFDILLGLQKRDPESHIKEYDGITNLQLSLICAGISVLFLLSLAVALALTKAGRTEVTTWWLYYFGSKEAFEKRYRYAFFTDTVSGRQVVCETSRNMNPVTLKEALEKGAYIDAYNPFGNTSLHLATREGIDDIVEVLLKHGANRSLLNHQNKTAEEMLPPERTEKTSKATRTTTTTTTTMQSEAKDTKRQESYQKIRMMYEKYRNKKFRRWVPQKFPTMLFRIYATDSTDDKLTNEFNDNFVAITQTEVDKNITHMVVKTDEVGALVTSEVEVLLWVIRGTIVVREEWMRDSLEDPRLIEHDERYVVNDLRWNDVLYKGAIAVWSEAMAKRKMPYLQGIHIVIAMQECPWYDTFESISESLGATLWTEIQPKERYNSGAHGYYHSNKNCFWIVHDGSCNLTQWSNDPDHIYEVMSQDEFFLLLVKRDLSNRVTMKNPIPVLSEQ